MAPASGIFLERGKKARSILEYSISVGIGGIQGYLAPLFNGAIADLPFETRRLIVKADPAQLLDQARPVTRAGPLQPPQKPQVSSSDPSYQIAPSDDPAFVFSLIWIVQTDLTYINTKVPSGGSDGAF
jgi:hypothetical protein